MNMNNNVLSTILWKFMNIIKTYPLSMQLAIPFKWYYSDLILERPKNCIQQSIFPEFDDFYNRESLQNKKISEVLCW